MPTLSWITAGTGGGTLTNPSNYTLPASSNYGVSIPGTHYALTAKPNIGSVFSGWSCVSADGTNDFSQSNLVLDYGLDQNYTCTATFNLPPPVSASVESNMALALTFIGVMLIAAFKSRKARKT